MYPGGVAVIVSVRLSCHPFHPVRVLPTISTSLGTRVLAAGFAFTAEFSELSGIGEISDTPIVIH